MTGAALIRRMPLEIHQDILDLLVDDPKALKACATTLRIWSKYATSLLHIFLTVYPVECLLKDLLHRLRADERL